jgi:hypothetical protein
MKYYPLISGEMRRIKDAEFNQRRAKAYLAGIMGEVRIYQQNDFAFERTAYERGREDDKKARVMLASKS